MNSRSFKPRSKVQHIKITRKLKRKPINQYPPEKDMSLKRDIQLVVLGCGPHHYMPSAVPLTLRL